MTKTNNSLKNFIKNNILQALVIILSVLLSFYLEQRRQVNITKQEKNYLLTDLTKTLESDIDQIELILNGLAVSDKNLLKLLDDINNNHSLLSDREVAEVLLQVQIGTSFFPQDGIFNELISNGSFNLIENDELKALLLNMYTHKKERNYATSTEIDNFHLSKQHHSSLADHKHRDQLKDVLTHESLVPLSYLHQVLLIQHYQASQYGM